jgi:hypothetical protein
LWSSSSVKAQSDGDVVGYGNYQAVIYYSKSQSKGDEDVTPPTKFMNSDNQRIIDSVKMMGCNTIFFSVSTITTNDSCNTTNLGINTYVHTNGVKYLDKMVDFLDKCANQGIKVFALVLDDPTYVLTANHGKARKKFYRILYYQQHVRLNPANTSFITKKAHFHGIVTNLEPWNSSTGWGDICTSAVSDNNILGQYLALVAQLRRMFNVNQFYAPPQPYGTPQPLDGLLMGTVHWFWHYYSVTNPQTFPNGNFSLYTGEHNGITYFDVILPETYCPQNGNTCINNLPCVAPGCSPCDNGTYANCESVGRCYQWFENHFILGLDSGYPAGAIRPIDAAPMMYGHSAFMFSKLSELHHTRWFSADVTRSCYGKSYHYMGSFSFHYEEMRSIFDGRVGALPALECQPYPDSDFLNENEAELCIQNRSISYYPNPATYTLQIDGMVQGDLLRLYNHRLEMVRETYNASVNVSDLPEGFYFIVITDSENRILFRGKVQIDRP